MSSNAFAGVSYDKSVEEPTTQNTSAEQTQSQQTMASPGGYTSEGFCNDVFSIVLPPMLPPEGVEHQKMVVRHLESQGNRIATYQLSGPFSGTMFVMGNKAIVTIYNDTLEKTREPDTPASSIIQQVQKHVERAHYQQAGPDAPFPDILSTFLVFKEDYNRHRACANFILTALIHNQHDAPNQIGTIASLSREKYRINTDQGELRNYVDFTSPHGVPDFVTDYVGLEIFRNGKWDILAVMGQNTEIFQIPGNNAYGGYGGYNNYTQPTAQFLPVIHLQSPVTIYPHLNLMGILLPLAMHEFGVRGLWQQRFRSFDPKRPNIGQLFAIDPDTGKPPFIADAQSLDGVLRDMFVQPAFALDVMHGRANIPCLELFADKHINTNQSIGNIFAHFFQDPSLVNANYVTKVYREIVGAMNSQGGTRVDTRSMDFFELVDKLPPEFLDHFRIRGQNEYDRIKVLREFFSASSDQNIEARYLNNIAFLDGYALNALGAAINGKISLETTERYQQPGISGADINQILSTYGNPYQTGFTFVAPHQYNPYNNSQLNNYFNNPYGYNR